MPCPLCHQRKPRRACPALGAQICAVCCGTKRLVEIACPSDCPYLEAADRHPAAAVKRRQEHDLAVLTSSLGPLSQPQLQLFFVIQAFVAGLTQGRGLVPDGGLNPVQDGDLAEAAAALAASFETAARGVVYEQQCSSVVAEEMRRSLRAFLAEMAQGTGSRLEREAAVVLRGIERGARHQADGLPDGNTAYLESVRRILQERIGHKPGASSTPPPDEPRIVITG